MTMKIKMKLFRKSLFSLTFIPLMGHASGKGFKEIETLISEQTTSIIAHLNVHTVLCFTGDYGRPSLKVVLPQLTELAELDHTSNGSPGPCVNAGFCQHMFTDPRLDDLITSALTEEISVTVRKTEVIRVLDGGTQCWKAYKEDVSTMIRGIPFFHSAQAGLLPPSPEECQKLAQEK